MTNRILKVNQVIKEEVSRLLFREVDFGQGVLVTVTKVDTSVDLSQTRILINVLPLEKTKEVLGKLNKEVFNLQKLLNKRLEMRPVPKVKFELDRSGEQVERIEEILKKIKNER